jgi:D-arabinose 1-dehydrogenase-like Zn-dependent alcohol dehydrogenase
MATIPAYAAVDATSPLAPFRIGRRAPGPRDVRIDILYCGDCHADIHQVRGEWGGSIFPMVPGHGIVGRVSVAGDEVTRDTPGDDVGVGCFVDSGRRCPQCEAGLEQYCDEGMAGTCNARERDTGAPTQGGCSARFVVDDTMVLPGTPEPGTICAFPLVSRRRSLAGSMIGGIAETQETLDVRARHGIAADIEPIGIEAVKEARERMLRSDVRYRFVIDIASLKDAA